MKRTLGTITKEGVIPHLKHPDGYYMPVKLQVRSSRLYLKMPPLRIDDDMVYALPGGGDYRVIKK